MSVRKERCVPLLFVWDFACRQSDIFGESDILLCKVIFAYRQVILLAQ